MTLLSLPNEVFCNISKTLNTRNIQSLRCVCRMFKEIFSDEYLSDLRGIKLYDHQLRSVKFLLEREAKGLNSILNLDTGIGKTAVVLYSYISNPVPTVIILKSKHVIIWQQELAKYNIKLPILTLSKVRQTDLSVYKRFILDEIHEKIFTNYQQRKEFTDKTKHGVIWGLTANDIQFSSSGGFKHVQLMDIFHEPSCVINIRLNQLETSVRQRFRLPTFHLIDSLDYVVNIKEKDKYIEISEYLLKVHYHFDCKAIETGMRQYSLIYNKDLHNECKQIINLSKCPHINEDGTIILDGVCYYDFDVVQWIGTYNKAKYYNFNDVVVELVGSGDKRCIIYSDSIELQKNIGYDSSLSSSTYANRCKLFMQGHINILFIPKHYNAGYNFGKIDRVIISRIDNYIVFKQIMGRINRLDQTNATDVYILCCPREPYDPESHINRYKNEFV